MSPATKTKSNHHDRAAIAAAATDPIIVYPCRLHRSTLDGLTEAAEQIGGGKAAGLVRKVLREWVAKWRAGQRRRGARK